MIPSGLGEPWLTLRLWAARHQPSVRPASTSVEAQDRVRACRMFLAALDGGHGPLEGEVRALFDAPIEDVLCTFTGLDELLKRNAEDAPNTARVVATACATALAPLLAARPAPRPSYSAALETIQVGREAPGAEAYGWFGFEQSFDVFTNEPGLAGGVRALGPTSGAVVGVGGGAVEVAARRHAAACVVFDGNPAIGAFVRTLAAILLAVDAALPEEASPAVRAAAVGRWLLGGPNQPDLRGALEEIGHLRWEETEQVLAGIRIALRENVDPEHIWLRDPEAGSLVGVLTALALDGRLLSRVAALEAPDAGEPVARRLDALSVGVSHVHLSNALEYAARPARITSGIRNLPGSQSAVATTSMQHAMDWMEEIAEPERKVLIDLGCFRRPAVLPLSLVADRGQAIEAALWSSRRYRRFVFERTLQATGSTITTDEPPASADELDRRSASAERSAFATNRKAAETIARVLRSRHRIEGSPDVPSPEEITELVDRVPTSVVELRQVVDDLDNRLWSPERVGALVRERLANDAIPEDLFEDLPARIASCRGTAGVSALLEELREEAEAALTAASVEERLRWVERFVGDDPAVLDAQNAPEALRERLGHLEGGVAELRLVGLRLLEDARRAENDERGLGELFADPSVRLEEIDLEAGRAVFVTGGRTLKRIDAPSRARVTPSSSFSARLDDLEPNSPHWRGLIGPMHFVFMTGYACSTLLARMLEASGRFDVWNEPPPLMRLAWAARRGAREDARWPGLLAMAAAWLARPLPRQAEGGSRAPRCGGVVIKEQPQTTTLAAELLKTVPGARAIFAFAPLEEYVLSVLRVPRRRRDARYRVRGFSERAEIEPTTEREIDALGDGAVAALHWMLVLRTWVATTRTFGERLLAVSSRTLLKAPELVFSRVMAHFGQDEPEAVARVMRTDVLRRYSKGIERPFDADARQRELAHLRSVHAAELAEARAFAETRLEQRPLPAPLPQELLLD